MDLLHIFDRNKSHYVYIKDFDRFMFHKAKNKNNKYFCKSRLVCLTINGAQSVRLEKGTIKFKNDFKQIVSFKTYSDFECILNNSERFERSCSKVYQDHIHCSFAYKPVCFDDRFSKAIVFVQLVMTVKNLMVT